MWKVEVEEWSCLFNAGGRARARAGGRGQAREDNGSRRFDGDGAMRHNTGPEMHPTVKNLATAIAFLKSSLQ